MSSIISLKDRHTDATKELILSTAIHLLETGGVGELTVRALAKAAGMSERTIFRYFTARDEFLDAVAAEAIARMQSPPPPTSVEQLPGFPSILYKSFEKRGALVSAILHTDIFKRVRAGAAGLRWKAVEKLIDEHAPARSKAERRIAATNINYYLSATTWHYYRFNFEMSVADTIACASAAIRLTVTEINTPPKK